MQRQPGGRPAGSRPSASLPARLRNRRPAEHASARRPALDRSGGCAWKGHRQPPLAARLPVRLMRAIRSNRSLPGARTRLCRRNHVDELVRQVDSTCPTRDCRVGAHSRVEGAEAAYYDLVGALVEFASADGATGHDRILNARASRVTSRSTSRITPDGSSEDCERPRPIVWSN